MLLRVGTSHVQTPTPHARGLPSVGTYEARCSAAQVSTMDQAVSAALDSFGSDIAEASSSSSVGAAVGERSSVTSPVSAPTVPAKRPGEVLAAPVKERKTSSGVDDQIAAPIGTM